MVTGRSSASLSCPSCGEPATAADRFCSACGRTLPERLTCPRCGASLEREASFCARCGASVTVPSAPTTRSCPRCQSPLSPSARFCKRCGQTVEVGSQSAAPQPQGIGTLPLPSVTTPGGRVTRAGAPGAGRAKLSASGSPAAVQPDLRARYAIAVLAVILVAAIGFWQLGGLDRLRPNLGSPTPASTAQGTPASANGGLSQRPAQTVTHASGARAEAPAGPVIYSPEVRWSSVDTPENLKPYALSPVLQFDQFSGLVFDKKTTVDLPTSGGAESTVYVWSRLGCWIPLPSTAVTLSNGQAGRRVVVDREPTPWTFVVARRPADTPASDDVGTKLVRLEQLRWTDKAALADELLKEETTTTTAAPSLLAVPVAEAAPDAATDQRVQLLYDATKDFEWAALGYNDMSKVQAMVDRYFAEGLLKDRTTAFEYGFSKWEAGLRLLRDLKKLPGRDGLAVAGDWIPTKSKVAEGAPFDQLFEEQLALWAPWGLDFTLALIDQGVISRGSFHL
jgi:Double zinc ribbon